MMLGPERVRYLAARGRCGAERVSYLAPVGRSTLQSSRAGASGSLKQQYELTEATNRVSFGAKDEIFCLFQGSLDNLGSLK
ncbi:hypothetical protein DY000_02035672 [Brassica cretica]|uniref:DUF3700 domain-containing protein n=1 Tax=Brassica cretica TaxID=69181 RepID=A0ABQ7DIE5_BRACR|nr:hypothetical protein DY000_02035672 [Brassica cretica]